MIILITIDILFLATGQLTLDSPSSLILQSIENPETIITQNFWSAVISGVTGLSALAIGAIVVVGLVSRRSDIVIFVAMGITLSLLIGDYLVILTYLLSINKVLATISFGVLAIIFPMIIVEWVRNKD